MKIVDLRSDTVTRPTPAMRAAMAEAEVGDDVYAEDPSVNRLQARLQDMLGFEAALFCPSGTQSNLLALMGHCERGDEYLVGQEAHTYKYEGGGAAVLGSIQPQPVEVEPDGTLDLARLRRAVKPLGDPHFARTRLLCLENTINGKVLPNGYAEAARAFAGEHGLAMHLDGARLFNAAVAAGVSAGELCRPFDSVSICLSKGLGAPVGSVLCGSNDLIDRARRWRKVVGGGMRQAGILAAAGLHALDHHIERLAEDHRRARMLAEGLAEWPELGVDPARVQTNMVFVRPAAALLPELTRHLEADGIHVGGRGLLRLVTHLDVDDDAIGRVLASVATFFERRRPG